jgi:bifunctional non-homologous end joining protein LigD
MPRRPGNAGGREVARRRPTPLPAFIPPMLAVLVEPFDSDRHLFEVKWDGFRSLAFIDGDGVRLAGRRKTDFTGRFPELVGPLARLPQGTVLDGEVVHLTDGKPDFQALLRRERRWTGTPSPRRQHPPVTFVAFELLYDKFTSIMPAPLAERRERLARVMAGVRSPRLALSDGHVGGGLALLDHAVALGLEGVMAKRLDGPYEPGGRSGSWAKFKRRQSIPCLIFGYQPNTTGGIKSLILAAEVDGELRFVGQVGGGIDDATHHKLLERFGKMASPQPLLSCRVARARWLRPELFCRVSFAEWTNDGKLRQPVFESLL